MIKRTEAKTGRGWGVKGATEREERARTSSY